MNNLIRARDDGPVSGRSDCIETGVLRAGQGNCRGSFVSTVAVPEPEMPREARMSSLTGRAAASCAKSSGRSGPFEAVVRISA